MIGTIMISNNQQTRLSHRTHHHNHQDICVSDTDMSEHGTVKSSRSTRHSHHHHHQHRSNQSNKHRSQSSKQQQQQRPPSNRTTHNQSSRSVNFQQQQQNNNIDENNLNEENEDERIQVQVIQQDDNWGENTTAYTAATSEFSDYNDDNMTEDGRSQKDFFNANAQAKDSNVLDLKTYISRYSGFFVTLIICFCTYITPILFIILPRINIYTIPQSINQQLYTSITQTTSLQQWLVTDCGIECEGLIIGISFKLFLVLLGVWALYFRKPRYTLPRVHEIRALILFLLCILTFSYWLFYGVRIIDTHQSDYYKILQFTASYVDVLLFIYILGVFLLEIRKQDAQFVVRLVRSPDGKQFEYTIGKMSIQRAAIYLLEQYYKDFPVFNPWLENAHKKRVQSAFDTKSLNNKDVTSLKYYDIDSANVGTDVVINEENNKIIETNLKNGKINKSNKSKSSMINGNGHNDRFYEEYEYERRLRKRKARLLTATEEAFTHIKRIQLDQCPQTIMDPLEAAQAIFMSIARELRRYLRITRQQPYFTRDSIVKHLAECISYDMSPRSFLQRYLNSDENSLIFNQRALHNNQQIIQVSSSNKFKTPDQSWILICDNVLYQNIEDNLMLVLKQNEITIMCTFKRLPYFNLIEDILDPKRNKFVLKMSSETSV